LVFNPRLVASTQNSQSQTARTLSRFNPLLKLSPLYFYQNTQEVTLIIGTYSLYCVANQYCATHVIIASGGQPTEQFQSLPNQPMHVASLRPLDLNNQAHVCCKKISDHAKSGKTAKGNSPAVRNQDPIDMTPDNISSFLKDHMGLLDKDTKLSIIESLMPKDFPQAQN